MSFLKKRQDLIYPLLDIPLNGLNYLFLIMISRYVTPDEYGIANALLSIAALLMVMGHATQTLTAKRVSENHKTDDLVAIFISVLVCLLLIGFIYLGSVRWLGQLTRSSAVTMVFVYIMVVVDALAAIYRGWCQGLKHFLQLNLNLYITVIAKLIFVVLILPLFPSPIVVILSLLVGVGLSLLYPVMQIRRQSDLWQSIRRPIPIKGTLKAFSGIAISQLLIQYLLSVDVILVNSFLPSVSGIYVVAAKYGQLILFVALSIFTVLFPVLNRAAQHPGQLRILLQRILLSYAGVIILILALYRWVVPMTIPMLFGEQYVAAAPFLLYAAIAYCLLSFFYLFALLFIVKDDYTHVVFLLGAAVLLTILYIRHHGTISHIFITQIAVYSLLSALLPISWLMITGKRDNNLFKRIRYRLGWNRLS